MESTYTFGKTGEKLALSYLEDSGYKIKQTNWRFSKCGEIDIIAEKGNTLIFIEVKTRKSNLNDAKELITLKKQKQLIKLAKTFLYFKKLGNRNCRFDVIAIKLNENERMLEHVKGAFWMG